jgi:hypothetical protein
MMQQQAAAQQQTASAFYGAGGLWTTTTSSTNTIDAYWIGTTAGGGGSTCATVGSGIGYPPQPDDDMRYQVQVGRPIILALPDGTLIDVKADGSYEINDSKATVVYRANRVREFNRYLNASDLLEAFIRFCGKEARVRRTEMLGLPIKLFIAWLVMEAAKADKEPEPDDIKLIPDLRKAAQPRCRCCNHFVSLDRHRAGLAFCSTPCFETAQARVQCDSPGSSPDRTPALACQPR